MMSVRCCLILSILALTTFKIATTKESVKYICNSGVSDSYVVGNICDPGAYVVSWTPNISSGVNVSMQLPCNDTKLWCYFVTVPKKEIPANICLSIECLPERRQELNLCKDTSTTADKLYLASPQFFKRQPPNTNTTKACHCRITTSSPAHIRFLYVSDANGLNVTAGASPVTLSTKVNSTTCVEDTVDIVVNQSNPVWLEVTGQNLSLKCNREFDAGISSEKKSGLCSNIAGPLGPDTPDGVTPVLPGSVVVYIVPVVTVITAAMGAALAVTLWRKRRKLTKEDDRHFAIPDNKVKETSGQSQPRIVSLNEYSDIVQPEENMDRKRARRSWFQRERWSLKVRKNKAITKKEGVKIPCCPKAEEEEVPSEREQKRARRQRFQDKERWSIRGLKQEASTMDSNHVHSKGNDTIHLHCTPGLESSSADKKSLSIARQGECISQSSSPT